MNINQTSFYSELENRARLDNIQLICVRGMIVNKNNILLLKRSLTDSMPGIYEFPGGVMDSGENLERALIREIQEETGLIINNISNYLGHFDYKSKKRNIIMRQFTFLIESNENKVVISSEHDDFQWISLDSINLVKIPLMEQIIEYVNIYKKLKM
jgi:8-oxo-dGTP diphosphatase